MIEKLERHIRVEKGLTRDIKISCPPEQSEMVNKINELVDAVNKLETMAKNTNTVLKSLIEENNTHKKQIDELQWVGKLCRCWDSDINDDIWGILQDIKDNKTEKYYLYGIGYEHCEPVKPDDDIIYKGGDNE